jgi:hypothetical protein
MGAEFSMSNLIPMDKAAAMLGISVDRLTEMRSSGEIHGLRDGTSWKFKQQELDRIADELGITLKAGGDDSDDFELSDSSGSEPVLLDESEELLLDDSSDSGVFQPKSGNIVDEDAPSKKKGPADTDKLGVKKGPGSSKKIADDDLLLAEEEDISSDFEDSDLILDDSDSSGDLAATGKKKAAADDDEFALSDEGLQLGGSDIDDLELSNDGDMLSLAEPDDAESEALFPEDDFNLTPSEPADSDDSSGSQVIALDESDVFSSGSDATMLQGGADFSPVAGGDGDLGGELVDTMSPGPIGGPVVTVPAAEAPFSLWQVLSLGLLLAVMVPSGMIAYDLCRNLWAPEGATISSGLLPFILEVFQ